jgi:hypothetical protein
MKYYALDYRSINAGDWIQSLAALQFYSEITHSIDRDSGKIDRSEEYLIKDDDSFMIYNGWTNTGVGQFDWLEKIKNIIPISVNLQPKCFENLPDFFIENEIGLRDMNSYNRLSEINKNSYFSSCLTLLLKNNDKIKSGKIIINELDRIWNGDGPVSKMGKDELNKSKRDYIYEIPSEEYYEKISKIIPKNLLDRAIFTDHDIYELRELSYKESLEITSKLLDEYSQADLVITSRLHTALPCLAMNIPVVFIWWKGDHRFTGLLELFGNFYDIPDFVSGKIDFENLKNSRNDELFNKYKNEMLDKIKTQFELKDLEFQYNDYKKIIENI